MSRDKFTAHRRASAGCESSHGVIAVFDEPNLMSSAGLVPVLQVAERAGLHALVKDHLHLAEAGGVNGHLKVPALVAGMVAGADSIEDMDLLRPGAMRRLFTGIRASSTLGTFLRSFTFGHVRQLDAVAARLRKGSTNSARGAARFVADALVTLNKIGASGVLVLRADSAYDGHDVIAATLRQGACSSITARQDTAVRTAIASIDEDTARWISDAEVAEIDYTAFTSKTKAKQVTARLIVRRVTDMNPDNQSELFTAYPGVSSNRTKTCAKDSGERGGAGF